MTNKRSKSAYQKNCLFILIIWNSQNKLSRRFSSTFSSVSFLSRLQVCVSLWSCLWICSSSSVLGCHTATKGVTGTWPAWAASTITTMVEPMPSPGLTQTGWRSWTGCSISSSCLRTSSPWPAAGFWWSTPASCSAWGFSESLTAFRLCCWGRLCWTSWSAWATSLPWPSTSLSCRKPTIIPSVRRGSRCTRAKGTRASSASTTGQTSQEDSSGCWGCLCSSSVQC